MKMEMASEGSKFYRVEEGKTQDKSKPIYTAVEKHGCKWIFI